jgi:ribosome-binding factor A
VGHLLQQELARLLVEGIKDPRVGFVTVTEVRVTDDLKHAQAYVSILGDDSQRQSTLAGLKAAAGFVKRELGQRCKLRYIPSLSFEHDDTLDNAQRLEVIFAAVKRGETEIPPPEALEPLPKAQIARVVGPLEIAPTPKAVRQPPRRTGRRNKRVARRK